MMMLGWKVRVFPVIEPSGGGGRAGERRCRIGTSFCLLAVLSFVFVWCWAFYNQSDYRWWPHQPCGVPSTRALADAGACTATNLSHIVFGIGGSARRWNHRRGYTELWWRPGETRGHVWLDEAPPDGTWPATSPPYRVSADASRFGEKAAASRMARIVAESQRLHGEDGGVRWYVMGDDDTVFFVDNLVATLGKYDHEQMYYVGAPSESVEQDVMHSYGMAFGGGGFAVSAPAAAVLAQVMDGCLERYARNYGSDQRVYYCLSELGVPLTGEPGFHQLDIRGDAYGLLAAHPVAPLVSLHHLDFLAPITPSGHDDRLGAVRTLTDASHFDPARVLQQCFCYLSGEGLSWSVSVSWGYTVQIYPWVLPAKDLEVPFRTFRTWRSSSDGPFTSKTRPFKEDQPCERPLLFFLECVERGEKGHDGEAGGATVSEYTRHGKEKDGRCNRPGYDTAALMVETVRVSAPKMDPEKWRQAPRRQCCQVQRTRSGRTLEVLIRSCHPGDITSPPH